MSARLALITGASSGIGAALASLYAEHGYDLALTARRAERLEAVADDVRLRFACRVLVIPADLAEAGAPRAIVGQIADAGRTIDALANNAGFGSPAPFAGQAWPETAAFLQVMLGAVVELTALTLPGMVERRFGRILNVASLAGLVPGAPGTALYGAVKAFLVRFSQSLHAENRAAGVHVSALCPGFTHSGFHEANDTAPLTADAPAWMWMGADEVAAAGFEAVEANRPVCVPGAPSQALAAMVKLLPDEWTMGLMARQLGGR